MSIKYRFVLVQVGGDAAGRRNSTALARVESESGVAVWARKVHDDGRPRHKAATKFPIARVLYRFPGWRARVPTPEEVRAARQPLPALPLNAEHVA